MLANVIAVCGADKCGKATQSQMLAQSLRKYNDRVALVEVPVNDHLTHRIIYRMLRNGRAKTHPNLFQFVQFINKFVFQWTYMLWLWLTHDWIILDRWRLSAIVYGDAGGASRWFNRLLYWFLWEPTVTVVLSGPSFERSSTIDDVYEKDVGLQTSVREGYYEWAMERPEDHMIVDNRGTKERVHERLLRALGFSQPSCAVCGATSDQDCDAGLHS